MAVGCEEEKIPSFQPRIYPQYSKDLQSCPPGLGHHHTFWLAAWSPTGLCAFALAPDVVHFPHSSQRELKTKLISLQSRLLIHSSGIAFIFLLMPFRSWAHLVSDLVSCQSPPPLTALQQLTFFFLSLNHAKLLKLCSCSSLNLQFSFPQRGLAFLPLGFCSNVTSSKKPSLTTLSKRFPHCPPSHNSYRVVLGSFSSLYLQLSSYAHHQLDFWGQGLCHSCLLLKP